MQPVPEVFRLHLGGQEVKDGWKIFDIQAADGVDFVGDIQDLSRFADGCCDEIYASHVLEHVPAPRVLRTLQGFHRILKPGGRAMISVPDLELLCQLFLSPDLDADGRFDVMRMMYGGQMDPHDFHRVGLSLEFLQQFLATAGFGRIETVESFGLFDDSSNFTLRGSAISLNVVAYKS